MIKTAIFILMTTTILAMSSKAQTLFSYGKNNVDKEEFLRQFNRNLNPKEDRSTAMKAYLPLFINYKLKVKDAYDKHLDTQYNQIQELVAFRQQISDNSFSEEANINTLIDEAFQRSQKDIRLQDIIVGFDPKDEKSMADAQATANKAMQKLKAGVDFDNVLYEFCTDNSFRANKGDLGWITVFSLPYRIENAAYTLQVGKYSEPIRTNRAFHIIKKTAERKALGKLKIAQILVAYAPEATNAVQIEMKSKADSIYKLLQTGSDFASMAKAVSNDKTSYMNGGELPEFGVGAYESQFENVAFSLPKNGALSKPFTTAYGIHILKLLDKVPVVSDKKDANNMAYLRQRINADNRMEIAKANLVKNLQGKIGFQPNSALNKKALWQYCDSVGIGAAPLKLLAVNNKTELFKYTSQSVNADDFVKYIKTLHGSSKGLNETSYNELLNQFVNLSGAEYYKQHMDEYNPEFKNQLQEFKDANLNFEATEKMVWNKAAQDSIGLANEYAANKAKYQWAPSVDAIIITSSDTDLTKKARVEIENNMAGWRAITAKYDNKILADSNRFEQSQIPVPENGTLVLIEKSFTPIATNQQDKSQTFCYIVKKIDQPGQRSFDEARGFVINDYQQVLETRWIDYLKKKYPVKVNELVWQAVLKN